MSVDRRMLFFPAAFFAVSCAIAASLTGCEEPKIPPPSVADAGPENPGCNGGAFIAKMEEGKENECAALAAAMNSLASPESDPKAGEWIANGICPGSDVLPTDLRGICTLVWYSKDGAPPDKIDAKQLIQIPIVDDLVAYLAEDCVTTAAQGESSLMEQAGPEMHAVFRKAAGANFDYLKLPATSANPYVFALDTLSSEKVEKLFGSKLESIKRGPVDEFPWGRDEHGWNMLEIIRDLTSLQIDPTDPEKKLPIVKPGAFVALPSVNVDNIDMRYGGFFGRKYHLVNAICEAIDSWKEQISMNKEDSKTAPPPVINLSLGALPSNGQKCQSETDMIGDESNPTDDSTALTNKIIYRAMQHAACHGAAIVVAAGNDPNGGNDASDDPNASECEAQKGPTCPGGMGKIPAPNREQCIGLYAQHSDGGASDAGASGYDPDAYKIPTQLDCDSSPDDAKAFCKSLPKLVYMVSGVEPDGKLLQSTRKGGRAALAAIGARVAMQDRMGKWHMPLTGSSVATAVVSAAFAALFAYDPTLTAAGAAKILYESGVELPDKPIDDATGQRMKMISICHALEAALELPDPLGCTPLPVSNAESVVTSSEIVKVLEGMDVPISLPMEQGTSIFENPTIRQCEGDGEMAVPTPGSTRCRPECGVVLNLVDGTITGEAVIQLDIGTEVAFSNLSLVFHSKDPTVKERFTLSNFGFAPGSRLKLTGIHPTISKEKLRNVTFEAKVEGSGYTSSVSGEIPAFFAGP